VILPYNTVAFFEFTAIFESIPNFWYFSAETDRDIFVEAVDGID